MFPPWDGFQASGLGTQWYPRSLSVTATLTVWPADALQLFRPIAITVGLGWVEVGWVILNPAQYRRCHWSSWFARLWLGDASPCSGAVLLS
ncbi:hypothetical protein DNTS_028222 [Danionella cerebrum]|uniref:Uncharacterized protein n=1 Tax=Danionella cerebrum TaxID=2873325 RepID=A0A553QN91_9TELE|nr:hypothetical protein DNTS_028222 [Danionella translucida]